MRAVILLLALAACGSTERAPGRPTASPAITAPGLRLPDIATPLAYDLELDIDPNSEIFRGKVTIEVRLERATDHLWLHADQLAIARATWSGGTLTPVDVKGEQMRAYRFGRVVEPGIVKLSFEYSGTTEGDQEGLFRQREGGAWYVFSQGESVFARRITPCFDEPRWKTPWRVSVVTPRKYAVLANMPETLTDVIEDGKKRVTFAETQPLPSYLLALAVGPFELVSAGTVGRNKVPVRIAVRAGEGKRSGVVAARLPAVVTAIENYLDDALPLTKLDIVGVPRFFGAMENPGLITFHEPILLGNPKRDAFADYFTYIAAHELVHQWFGNSVTPAWWDHLWLSEAFASWLGDKVTRELDAYDDPVLRLALARREAIAADRERDAQPLLRHVTTTIDADEGFDAIAYAKGQLVLSTFEAFIGADELKARVRAYVKSRRGRSVTSDDLYPAIAKGTERDAFRRYVGSRGTPVVTFALTCPTGGAAELVARAETPVPVCVSFGDGRTAHERCALVTGQATIALDGRCPAWVLGNPRGSYYHSVWKTHGPRGPAPARGDTPALARVTVGDDLAAAVERGELQASEVVTQLRELTEARDVYQQLAAVALVRAVDELVDEPTRTIWSAWLGARFADRLASLKITGPAQGELAQALARVVPGEFASGVTRVAHDILDKLIPNAQGELPLHLVALGSVHGGDKFFDRIVARARLLRDDEVRDQWIEALGEFPAAQVPKAVTFVVKGDLPIATTWLAMARFFARPATRDAAWRALKPNLAAMRERMSPEEQHELMQSVAHLCDKGSRDEVQAAFGGDKDLTTTLQAIDRCIDRRATLGDLGAALAAAK